jgi:hypothetical protein
MNTYDPNMQNLGHDHKTKPRTHGVLGEEGAEIQTKGIEKLFNETIA